MGSGAQENNKTMITKKNWERIGFLEELPEDRKDMVVNCFNLAIKWVTDDTLVRGKRQGELETLVLPIMYRIAKVVDLTESQVIEILKDFYHAWLSFDPTKDEKSADPELHFVKTFCESKINQYKN
jgi:hypothetical protein